MSNEPAAKPPRKKKPRKSFTIDLPQLSEGEDRALSRIVGNMLRSKPKPSPSLPQLDNLPQERELSAESETTHETTGETSERRSSETSARPSNKTSARISIEPSARPSDESFTRPSSETSIRRSTEISERTSPDAAKRKFISLDSTHTGAEQRVYSIMYRETISKGLAQRRFAVAELMQLTGINSNTTVIRALKGLCEKYSIKVVSREAAKRFGILYEVSGPKEILDAREAAGLVIEPRRKVIISGRAGKWDETTGETTHETTGDTSGRFAGSVASSADRPSERSAENAHPVVQKINDLPINAISVISDSSVATSSSHAASGDDERLAKVRDLFNQLSGGGTWKDSRDLAAYEKIKHIPLWHIVMGLCWSVAMCPEHHYSSLAYAVPAIEKHHRDMAIFPPEEMLAVAYKAMRHALLSLETGKWSFTEADVWRSEHKSAGDGA